MINDWSLLNADALSISVRPDQDKGMYRLAGNASDFYGTITVVNSVGVEIGSLSFENSELDYDITHYSLRLKDTYMSDLLPCRYFSSSIPIPKESNHSL